MCYIQYNINMLGCRNKLMKKKENLDYLKSLQDAFQDLIHLDQMKVKASHLNAHTLKELKNWSQSNAPSIIEPALSYALDWLSPELLGSGLKISHQTDFKIKAEIPHCKKNCDFQGQIHHGLVINAGLELIRVLISKHWPDNAWVVTESDCRLVKKNEWSTDLKLSLEADEIIMDRLLVRLQKAQVGEVDLEILIQTRDRTKKDKLLVNLKLATKKLLE